MKNLLFFFFAMVSLVSQAQKLKENQVPANVKNSFQKAYPNTHKAKWSKENNNFEAEFELNKEEVSVLLDASAQILETEIEIPASQLPLEVKEYVKGNYKVVIKEASKITNANGDITYEAEIKGKDLIFDKDGKFLKELKK